MKALQDLDLFVRTVQAGSLTAAARVLDMTPAAASAALKRLEAELGVELLVRSTRSLKLSAQGELFLQQAQPALQALHQAKRALTQSPAAIEGVLKLALPSDLGRNVLVPLLDQFQTLYPGVQLRLHLSDRLADVYSEPVDAAVRYSVPPDADLLALPLAPHARRVLCASPDYVKKHGAPRTPQELIEHDCLSFMLGDKVHDRWNFVSPQGKKLTVRVQPKQVANDGDVVRRWAVQGRGIAYKSGLDVAADLRTGHLKVLCKTWVTEPTPLYLVVPNRHQYSPVLRCLKEFLEKAFAQ